MDIELIGTSAGRLSGLEGVLAVLTMDGRIEIGPTDGKLSWSTHVAIGVGMGCGWWLVYLAVLVQQAN